MMKFKKVIFISIILFFMFIPKVSAKYMFLGEATIQFEIEDQVNLENFENFTVSSVEDLLILRNLQNTGKFDFEGKDIFLMEDIDLSEIPNWKGIGTETYPFKGNFYGNDCIISNLKINTTSDCQGLFGQNNGTITGVNVNRRNYCKFF